MWMQQLYKVNDICEISNNEVNDIYHLMKIHMIWTDSVQNL